MSLTKKTCIHQIEIANDGLVKVMFKTEVLEDGKMISSATQTKSFMSGDDLSGQPSVIAEICQIAHANDFCERMNNG